MNRHSVISPFVWKSTRIAAADRSASIQNGGSVFTAVDCPCHGDGRLQIGTFLGIPHKVLFWLMALPNSPPSRHSSALIYSSRLCDLALALPTTSSSGNSLRAHSLLFGVPTGGGIRQNAAPSHLIHTGPVLEGRWASLRLLSKWISHPEGSAARWARGVSGSVSLPSEELVWVCVKPIQHAHTVSTILGSYLRFMILGCLSRSS